MFYKPLFDIFNIAGNIFFFLWFYAWFLNKASVNDNNISALELFEWKEVFSFISSIIRAHHIFIHEYNCYEFIFLFLYLNKDF